ncbi:MAG: YqiJ family protein [Gammaproteobacteria bacterium]|nr:YqiJ family protein [Gammaproteobacteria bacterium]
MSIDETDAVSEETFIGRVAKITLGKAEISSPAQAKLKDEHGQIHYIMVEPDMQNEIFETGRLVILVSRVGAIFKAIPNDKSVLFDE